MSVRVHKVVSKAEIEGGKIVKTEIHPDDDWVLVDGADDATIIERFRANTHTASSATTDHKPNDAIRIHVKRDGDKIEIGIDRERGGAWWTPFEIPKLTIRFDYFQEFFLEADRKIRLFLEGGTLKKERIAIGEVNLFPPAKPKP